MKVAMFVDMCSPHQIPLASSIVMIVGASCFRYIVQGNVTEGRKKLGWDDSDDLNGIIVSKAEESVEWLENCDLLLTTLRDDRTFELVSRRCSKGLKTCYMSERWFKPWMGMWRLLHPGYFRMARRFVRLIKTGKVSYLPKGIWAARDMARLVGLFSGDIRCLVRAPRLDYVAEPMGAVRGYPWMKMWGYFVAPGDAHPIPAQEADEPPAHAVRVLWVGRLLRWKRVDTLFKAVYAAQARSPIALTIVGLGPELPRLQKLDQKLSKKYGVASPITYHAAVPVAEVRMFMRTHDVYVLPSNAYEGWGAVVSEALEERMEVFGTYEAGSSATMLPHEDLFPAGDWKALRDKLVDYAQTRKPHCHGIGKWSAKYAVKRQFQNFGI